MLNDEQAATDETIVGLPLKRDDYEMPTYFIKIGSGRSDYVFNIGSFDFSFYAKEQLNWFNGNEDSKYPQTPKLSSSESNFDIFSSKLLLLLRNYSSELKQYFPAGMNSTLKTAFSSAILAKFHLLEVKYQELKLKHQQGEYIGEHVKPKSLKWPSVLVSTQSICHYILYNLYCFYRE